MKKKTVLFLILAFVLPRLATAQHARAASSRIPDQIIVQLQPQASAQALLRDLNRQQPNAVQLLRTVARTYNIHLLQFDPARWRAEQLVAALEKQREVLAVQYNYHVTPRETPDDPEYELQWGVERIGTPAVWKVSSGGLTAQGDTIVVAIVDSGFDLQHEDLQDNIWHNPHEIPGDGIDNDQNGFTDDIYGWDFVADSDSIRYGDHGLSVSGILGAKGNNSRGIAGINWNIKMMFLTISRVDQIISSYEYVIEQRRRYNESNGQEGAFVVATNASFGLADPIFCEDQPVWGGMYDLLGEVGVLTGAGTANRDRNVDMVGDMPTTCESDFLLTVLNGNEEEERHTISGYGKVSIDMAAPGEGTYTLRPFNRYGAWGGNSAAAPHITGAIALLYSLPCELVAAEALSKPEETALYIRQALLESVDLQPGFEGITATGGRLNIERAMERIGEDCGGDTGGLSVLNLYPNPASQQITLEYQTPDFEDYDFRVYNALGQLVYQNQQHPNRFGAKTLEIDVSNWPQGMYVMTIRRNDEELESRKFIVAWPD